MKNYEPHDHMCPYCRKRKPCLAPQRGDFCIFPSSDDMTCPGCAVRHARQVDDTVYTPGTAGS